MHNTVNKNTGYHMQSENKAFELLERDLDSVAVPDVWKKISSRIEKIEQDSEQPHHICRKKHPSFIYAVIGSGAVCITVSLIIVIGANQLIYPFTDNETPQYNDESIPVYRVETGRLALSGRGMHELEGLLGDISSEDSIYEDGKYLYQFDGKDALTKMLDMKQDASEVDFEEMARKLIDRHFPDVKAENYTIELDKSGEYPSLTAKADVTDGSLTITEIKITVYTDEWQRLSEI